MVQMKRVNQSKPPCRFLALTNPHTYIFGSIIRRKLGDFIHRSHPLPR